MMSTLQSEIEQFLYHKAALCDQQQWDEWLALFDEQCEYHVPQWDTEHRYTTDPKTELSLMYYANRGGLEDRIFRIRTGKAASATPLPRTLHLISNVQLSEITEQSLTATVAWVTHYERLGKVGHFFGKAIYQLVKQSDGWKIQRLHTLLLNDTIDSVLDFYHL